MNFTNVRNQLLENPLVLPECTVDTHNKVFMQEWEDYMAEFPDKRNKFVLDDEGQPNIETRFAKGGTTALECFSQGIEYCLRSMMPRGYTWLYAREIMADLSEKKNKVLDYGCGAGNFGLLFALMGFNVDFLDVEGEITDFVKWRLKKRYLNCRVLNEKDKLTETYDLVNCWTVIEHIENYKEVIEIVCNAVKPNGLLFFVTSTEESGLDVMPKTGETWVREFIKERFEEVTGGILFRKK